MIEQLSIAISPYPLDDILLFRWFINENQSLHLPQPPLFRVTDYPLLWEEEKRSGIKDVLRYYYYDRLG
jgi:hypothetical protein